MHGRLLVISALVAALLAAGAPIAGAYTHPRRSAHAARAKVKTKKKAKLLGTLGLTVLSGRPDLVSGGDALVQVVVPDRIRASTLRVTLAGRDVTGDFALRADGRRVARLEGSPVGSSRLVARATRARSAVAKLVDHPSGGPVFAGPQTAAWGCPAGTTGPQCDAPPRYDLAYQPAGGRDFKPYDPSNPPDDVASRPPTAA